MLAEEYTLHTTSSPAAAAPVECAAAVAEAPTATAKEHSRHRSARGVRERARARTHTLALHTLKDAGREYRRSWVLKQNLIFTFYFIFKKNFRKIKN